MAEVDKGLLKKANLEKPVRFDKALKSYTTHANGRKSARSSQGRVWWNALCEAVEISEGTNEMRCEVFFPKGEDASGAIGMLPATLKGDDLSDWMGRQMQSAAVYFDGQVFQNGQRLNDVEPLVNDDFGVSLELEWSVGGTFTIYRNEVKVYQFHRVPDNWRFAIGGFGGRATLVDDRAVGFHVGLRSGHMPRWPAVRHLPLPASNVFVPIRLPSLARVASV